ncbi:ChrR family anti-sigma-E factor [Jannaschia rubra]|uniref:Transcriptional activator ChrR n=1 Tax=Jannaschia rubra TaxID=282197 RepID=A0A0M6XS19_9RHOB|nr:ChrR family anti-sigma-E factor [Jannaschia rubra]CTQ33598.1 Transcriptional activator ChrR [Jannaschia rubra]SFG04635.1 anti-ECFsigma factor, ChrR [Jannaschia rubra]
MSIRHPIGDDLLLGFAAGTLPAAHDLVVATAVSLDDDARARLGGFETLGGALLEQADAAPVGDDALTAVLGRLDEEEDMAPPRRICGGIFPAPLQDAVGGDLAAVRWRPVGMGARQAVLHRSPRGTARLLSIPAGQAMPDHSHRGTELTLVLTGAFRDGDLRFARGDLQVADASTEHRPTAEPAEDCICLVVTDAPLRFAGLLPRLFQRFLGI